jgi:serine/threonine protein kinase
LERPTSPINSFAQSRSLYEGRSAYVHECEREDESHAKKYGRHGDINPGNILWFDDGTQDGEYLTGTLKLADFGQAELNSLLSRTKPRSVANTMTYRPPECDLQDRTIRQSYDIWCLGCVLLEFTAWMLGGKDLMKKFSFNRLEPDVLHLNQKTDTFFQVVINSLGIPTDVMVKKSVTDVSSLPKHQTTFANKRNTVHRRAP